MTLRTADFERTYTNDEFENMPEFAESSYELIDGKVVYSMTGDEHGIIIGRLFFALKLADIEEKLGVVWTQTSFDLGAGWIPAPDIGYVVIDRRPPKSERLLKVVPDMVAEIWSPSDLSSVAGRSAARSKIRHYQEVGVRLIWSINPRTQTIEVYLPDNELPVEVLTVEDTLDGGEVIPGFTLAVAKIFE